MVAFQIGITKILKEKGVTPDIVGGLSIGEYSALYASGVITDKDAILIAEKRGVAMSKSSDVKCKMMAIVGAPVDLVRDVCEKVSNNSGYMVQISNLNCPGQIVIAGEENAIDEVVSILKENKIRKIIQLNVSGAFHSPLMQPAKDELQAAIEKVNFHTPKCPIIQNVDAKAHIDAAEIKANLIAQLTNSVRWTPSVQEMITMGATEFVECGPGKALQGMIARISKGVNAHGLV